MKPFICALALFTMLAPALAQDAATAPAKVEFLATPIEITPIKIASTDFGEFLDIQSWRFKVRIPKATSQTRLNRSLELRTPGKDPIIIASDSNLLQDFRNAEVSLMMMPEGGELTQAPRLRVLRKIQFIDNIEQKASAYISSTSSKNPLKIWSIISYSSVSDSPQAADGSIVLMNFDVENPGEQKTVKGQLVLVVTATLPTPEN